MLYEKALEIMTNNSSYIEKINKQLSECNDYPACKQQVLKKWASVFSRTKRQLFKAVLRKYNWKNNNPVMYVKRYHRTKFHSKSMNSHYLIYEFNIPSRNELEFMQEHGCGYLVVGKQWISIDKILAETVPGTNQYIYMVRLRK